MAATSVPFLTTPRPIKVLCLHGIGTNGKIFQSQLGRFTQTTVESYMKSLISQASITNILGRAYEFEFIDGEHVWDAAPGITKVYGEASGPFLSYSDGTPHSFAKAVQDLEDYLAFESGFDVVMGFSLGAALAATLLVRRARRAYENNVDYKQPFPRAVFFSATLPFNFDALLDGHYRQCLEAEIMGIEIPTLHVYDTQDSEYPGQSEILSSGCKSRNAMVVTHDAGHSIPMRGIKVKEIANAISQLIAQDCSDTAGPNRGADSSVSL